MPQFPLGSVLFPSMVLPLHVFEPRYRALADDVLGGDGEFGVVLIERGFEVGGGDVRSSVGTVAKVMESERFDDGRWALIAVGVRRFTVKEWLSDDPYPRAEVEDWPDDPPEADGQERLETVTRLFTRCWAMASEAGYDVGQLPELSDDVELGSMQLAALAPIPVLDQQKLLACPGSASRLDLLESALADAQMMFEFEIGGG